MRLSMIVLLLLAAATTSFGQDAAKPAPVVIDKLPFTCDKAGTYVLNADLVAEASGIYVQANDVIVDLGGHALTYGAAQKNNEGAITYNSLKSGNVGHHAIYVTSDPRCSKDAPNPPWNNRFTGVVIKNGTIKSGAGGISYSEAVDVTGTVGCEIANLTFVMSAPDSSAIVAGRQSKVHDCTVHDTNAVVSNRHAQLAVICCGPETEVFNCVLDGGAQVGVKGADGAHIHHNDIRQNATATNCYGVTGYGQKNMEVDHNLVIPANGRGIHCSEKSSGWKVHDNYVEVRERANKEYPKGMQTHGVKMEGTRDTKVWGNVVQSVSVPGGSPTPLNFDVEENSNNEVWNNVFIAKKVTEKEHATALYLVYGDGRGTKVHDNVFFTNDRCFECIWDAPQNYTFENNRFYRLSPEDKITTFYFWNAKPASGFKFVDCLFGPGIDPHGWTFPDTKEDWPKDADMKTEWTVRLTVLADGKPAPGAKVALITTQAPVGEFESFPVDANGKIERRIVEYSVHFDAETRKVAAKRWTPTEVRVFGGDAGDMKFEIPGDAPCDITVDLKAKTHVVTPRKIEPAPDVDKLIADAKANAGPKK